MAHAIKREPSYIAYFLVLKIWRFYRSENKIRLCFYVISSFLFCYIRIYQSIIICSLIFAVQSIQKYSCWLEKEKDFFE